MSVFLFFTDFHAVASQSIKFGTMVQDLPALPAELLDTTKLLSFLFRSKYCLKILEPRKEKKKSFVYYSRMIRPCVRFFYFDRAHTKKKNLAYSLCLSVIVFSIFHFQFSNINNIFLCINITKMNNITFHVLHFLMICMHYAQATLGRSTSD
jgi:hypothetical protein